jgi:hypothetical protein
MLASSTKPKRKGEDLKSRRKRNIKNQRERKRQEMGLHNSFTVG